MCVAAVESHYCFQLNGFRGDQSAMTIMPATLTRSAGIAAVAAGVIFIGVQLALARTTNR
jgi:hypothetical protein